VKATTALLELFKEKREWRQFFSSCCEGRSHRLTSQTWQFSDELKERGHHCPSEEVEDSLLGMARDLLPDTPAAQWDADWAHDLCKDALARLVKHYAVLSAKEKDALDLSRQDVWDEQMRSAGLANDPTAFRRALKGWERAGLEAIERARAKGGAA
jgi:non-homologous end joining protein Ku